MSVDDPAGIIHDIMFEMTLSLFNLLLRTTKLRSIYYEYRSRILTTQNFPLVHLDACCRVGLLPSLVRWHRLS